MKTTTINNGGSLARLVRRFGFRQPTECIGHKCHHGVPGKWFNIVGIVESVTPTGRLAVRHLNRVHIVPPQRIGDIYDECPDGKYGQHRKTPNDKISEVAGRKET
jgi:hypothetical protein